MPKWTNATSAEGGICGFKSSLYFNVTNSGQVHGNKDCDFPGYDFTSMKLTEEDCRIACLNNSRCSHFSYLNGKCNLKDIAKWADSVPVRGVVCGVLPNRLFFDGKKSDGVKWAFDCVYPGNDIGNTLIEFDKCGKKCVENPRCNYFSYFDNKCYLKYIENVPFRQYAAAVNCGYLPSRIVVPCQDEGTNYKPCRCKKQLNGNGTIVDCRDLSLTVLPPLNISDIDLVHFDLSGNNLTNIPQSTIDLLNKNVTLLSLAGNPWGCDCSNYYLLDFFFNWKLRIQDFQEMKCDSGKMIAEVKLSELCPKVETALMYIGWSLLALFILALVFFSTRYAKVLKFCLEKKLNGTINETRLQMSSMNEDEEREYDAFISFSHKDENFVIQELVPELEKPGENGLPEYRLCFHFRDW